MLYADMQHAICRGMKRYAQRRYGKIQPLDCVHGDWAKCFVVYPFSGGHHLMLWFDKPELIRGKPTSTAIRLTVPGPPFIPMTDEPESAICPECDSQYETKHNRCTNTNCALGARGYV